MAAAGEEECCHKLVFRCWVCKEERRTIIATPCSKRQHSPHSPCGCTADIDTQDDGPCDICVGHGFKSRQAMTPETPVRVLVASLPHQQSNTLNQLPLQQPTLGGPAPVMSLQRPGTWGQADPSVGQLGDNSYGSASAPRLPSFRTAFGDPAVLGSTTQLSAQDPGFAPVASSQPQNAVPQGPTPLYTRRRGGMLPFPPLRQPPMAIIGLNATEMAEYGNWNNYNAPQEHTYARQLFAQGYVEPVEWTYWRTNIPHGWIGSTPGQRLDKARQQVRAWPLPLPYESYDDFHDRQVRENGRNDTTQMQAQFDWRTDFDRSLRPWSWQAAERRREANRGNSRGMGGANAPRGSRGGGPRGVPPSTWSGPFQAGRRGA